MQARYEAVQATIKKIQTLGPVLEEPATREAICGILERLAQRGDLFPATSFSVRPGASGGIYELYVAPDRSLSLYASSGASGKYQPPHDHTTWAVIAGIRGVERNQFFECTDRDDATSTGEIRFVRAKDVGPGQSVTLAAEDFHTIAVTEGSDALHLHLYGNALDTLEGRIGFATEQGGTFKRFMAKPLTFAPWISQAELEAMRVDGLAVCVQSVKSRDWVAGVRSASPDPSARVVLVDVQSESDTDLEVQVRALLFAGYHNLAVLRPT